MKIRLLMQVLYILAGSIFALLAIFTGFFWLTFLDVLSNWERLGYGVLALLMIGFSALSFLALVGIKVKVRRRR